MTRSGGLIADDSVRQRVDMADDEAHPSDNGLRTWWLDPPRPGAQRIIAPYEYRHLRLFGIGRAIGGTVATVAGLICLGYDAYAWAAFFLIIGVLNLAGSYWYLTIQKSNSRTR